MSLVRSPILTTMKNLFKKSVFLIGALCLISACSDEDDNQLKITIVDNNGGGNTSKPEENSGGGTTTPTSPYVSAIEVPALATSDALFVAHEATHGSKKIMNYCYEFSPSTMHTRWVAFRFDAVTRQQTTGRSDEFIDDPQLPSQYWIGANSFSGYSRGHICASADRLWSSQANKQTFYMSNMSPQLEDFNSGIWADFENKMRDKCRDATFADTVYVVKGGTIANDQILGKIVRNGKLMVVPKYYFMAFLRYRYGSYDAIGIWLEHRGNYSSSDRKNLAQYLVSIDQLEEKTGIDFFHNLSNDKEQTVEAAFNKSLWGF